LQHLHSLPAHPSDSSLHHDLEPSCSSFSFVLMLIYGMRLNPNF
jgi:hypothetical protein